MALIGGGGPLGEPLAHPAAHSSPGAQGAERGLQPQFCPLLDSYLVASFMYDPASQEFEDMLITFEVGPNQLNLWCLANLTSPDIGHDRDVALFRIERGGGEPIAALEPAVLPVATRLLSATEPSWSTSSGRSGSSMPISP